MHLVCTGVAHPLVILSSSSAPSGSSHDRSGEQVKLCFVYSEHPPRPHGGIGTMTQVLGRALVQRGHTVAQLSGLTRWRQLRWNLRQQPFQVLAAMLRPTILASIAKFVGIGRSQSPSAFRTASDPTVSRGEAA